MIKSFKVYYGNQLSSPLTYLEKQVDGAVKEDFLKKMIPVLYHKLLVVGVGEGVIRIQTEGEAKEAPRSETAWCAHRNAGQPAGLLSVWRTADVQNGFGEWDRSSFNKHYLNIHQERGTTEQVGIELWARVVRFLPSWSLYFSGRRQAPSS